MSWADKSWKKQGWNQNSSRRERSRSRMAAGTPGTERTRQPMPSKLTAEALQTNERTEVQVCSSSSNDQPEEVANAQADFLPMPSSEQVKAMSDFLISLSDNTCEESRPHLLHQMLGENLQQDYWTTYRSKASKRLWFLHASTLCRFFQDHSGPWKRYVYEDSEQRRGHTHVWVDSLTRMWFFQTPNVTILNLEPTRLPWPDAPEVEEEITLFPPNEIIQLPNSFESAVREEYRMQNPGCSPVKAQAAGILVSNQLSTVFCFLKGLKP
jgi:hypothetical protein